MTARQIYEAVLIEMNKVQAPSLLLEDFNYFFNKAISQYINKRYNIYDINQQTTDDLRVLKATAILPVHKSTKYYGDVESVIAENALYGATYEVNLPTDYLHILNCVCIFKVKKRIKCYDKDTYVQFGAYRLTSDLWAQIINNFYMKPSYKKPYYFIHNTNINNYTTISTNPYDESDMQETGFGSGTDASFTTLAGKFDEYFEQGGGKLVNKSIYNSYVNGGTWSITPDEFPLVERNGVLYVLCWQNNQFVEMEYKEAEIQVMDKIITLSNASNTKCVDGVLYINDRMAENRTIILSYPVLKEIGKKVIVKALPDFIYKQDVPTDILPAHKMPLVEKYEKFRYGNASNVRMEVRYGKDDSIFELVKVYVDYIKAPQFIRLTQEQIDLTEDTSQIMEYPDYVCHEIINELTHIVMENASDPRVQSHIPISQSIANPAQAQENSKK